MDESPGKRLILVIDDEAPIRQVLELNFKALGFEVITANSGEEGLQLLETRKPDVVISDIGMPHMDGKTFCERIEPMKAERSFLTIMITGRLLPEEASWISKSTDTIFREKPFSLAKLAKDIDAYYRT
jgi:CheY-like chemotaxis protein